MDAKRIGVAGAGTMGRGIAQVCAASGFDVVMSDVSADAVAAGLAAIDKQLARAVEKERMSAAEKDAVLSRIETATGIEAMAGVDVCIEAATENPEVKLDLFRALESVCRQDCDPRFEYVLDLADEDRGCMRPPRTRDRHALLQPGAADEARRADSRDANVGCDVRGREGARGPTRQDRDRGGGQPRVRRQPDACADDQRGGLRATPRDSRARRRSTSRCSSA